MSVKKKPLEKIKSGAFSRGFSLARMSATIGVKAASHAIGGIFSSEDEKAERLKEFLKSQFDVLAQELGQLKGSLMKAGQMLSMMGEHFLPPEVNAVLKSLQSQSPPLKWEAIHALLLKELGTARIEALEIDPEPMASASLGQVHRARLKPGLMPADLQAAGIDPATAPAPDEWMALKVQYPGVDQAIEGDLRALKSLLALSKVIPRGVSQFDDVFEEVKTMLKQEVDYTQELRRTEEFRGLLGADPRFIVPKTFASFSNSRILATSLEEGVPVDGPEVRALPQEQRNALGKAALELYLKELFELGMVQTDPHFGNYRVRLSPNGAKLVLLDFGAVRAFDRSFLDQYLKMVCGAFNNDREAVEEVGHSLGFLREGDSTESKALFVDLCMMITEPFLTDEEYDWGVGDLPQRVMKKSTQMALAFKLRNPPREIIFLDRKMGGMFIFLKVLGVRFHAREIMRPFVLA